jgi:(p)ppGpp synthase/HD superfamily hydrolase
MEDLLEKAIEIAVTAHNGQKDKYDAPYIMHLIRVMNAGSSIEEKIVGVLHDLLEDTKWTSKELLSQGFPENIVKAVECLTRGADETYDEFIDRIPTNQLALNVKLNDLTDNMDLRRIPKLKEQDIDRLNKYVLAYHKLNSIKHQAEAG